MYIINGKKYSFKKALQFLGDNDYVAGKLDYMTDYDNTTYIYNIKVEYIG